MRVEARPTTLTVDSAMKRTPKQRRFEVVEQRRLPGSVSPEFIAYSKDFFRCKFGVEITDEDVREIVANATAFIKVLYEMDRRQKGGCTDGEGMEEVETDR